MLFRSYIGSYLPSGERLHTVEVNVQWWRCARALYSVAPNTIAKPVTKTPHGREQRHVNGYTLGCLQEQVRWPTDAPIQLPLEFCIFMKRLFYENPSFKSSDCSAEAIRRSSWPICYCLEKSNRGHTHMHTHYCNPAVHARRGLTRH